MKQIGRNVFQEPIVCNCYEDMRLSITSKFLFRYYRFCIKSFEKRKTTIAAYAAGYKFDLWNSYRYFIQAYLHKIDVLYGKDELRMLEKEWKHNRG